MTRISPWVLLLAFAVSACGNEAGGGADNAAAAGGAGNASAGAQAGESATASQSPPAPSNAAAQPVAAATLAGMPAGRPLGPLLEEDFHSPEKMGCNCMFDGPDGQDGRYLSVIDGELMVRTPAGRQLCPITEPELQSLGEGGGAVSCAGVRMSIRETGERVSNIESDSSSAPAILSATENGVTRTLEGNWGCAC